MTTPRATRRWLDLSDVATRDGAPEGTITDRIAAAQFPAPARLTASGPRWAATDLDQHAAGTHPAFADVGTSREQWLARLLDEVRWWSWQHGHASVPTSADGRRVGPQASRLGPRVTKVRALHRDGKVPASTRAAFEALPGWSWNEKDAAWRRRLDDVLTRWPSRLSTTDKTWLATQRGRLAQMPPDRAAALAAVPGLLTYQGNRRVHEFTAAVTAWLDEHPDATAGDLTYSSTVTIHGRSVPVGRRAGYYRRRYLGKESANPLSAVDVAAIEALPGWSWEQSERHVAAAIR